MTVKGKSIYHCHGSRKGKKFRTYSSHAKAQQVHRAIMAKKHISGMSEHQIEQGHIRQEIPISKILK